jgi:hypothetical protein
LLLSFPNISALPQSVNYDFSAYWWQNITIDIVSSV